MTLIEFAKIIAYIAAATEKPIQPERVEVYYDLLGDLEVRTLQAAAKLVVLEHQYPTFPTPAAIRDAASRVMQGRFSEPSSGHAWQMASKACLSCDVDVDGSVERELAPLPPLVRLAIHRFGFRALYNPGDNLEVMRAQFMKIYEQILAEQRQALLLPESLKQEIKAIGKKYSGACLPAPVKASLAQVGKIEEN